MKIEILKEGLTNKETKEKLNKGDKITVDKERGEIAISKGFAKEVKTKPKKSTQEKIQDELTKK